MVRREAVINLTEDLNVKVCEEAVTPKNLHRPQRLLNRLGGPPVMLGPRTSIQARSNRALLRCCNHLRAQRSLR